MRYNENKMTPKELLAEMERYEVEEYLKEKVKEGEALWGEMFRIINSVLLRLEKEKEKRIEGEEALCWAEYERQKKIVEKRLIQKDMEAFESMEKLWKQLKDQEERNEFEIAIQLLDDSDIPVKEDDVEQEIEECIKEASEAEDDPFVEMSKYKNPRKGISYRRKQSRRVKKMIVRNAIAADKSAAHRSKAEMRRRRKTVKPQLLENEVGESNSHKVFRQYNWENKSRSARAKRLRKAAERFIPKLNDFSQKHLEEIWSKKEESRAKQIAERFAEKEAAKQTA